MRSFHFVSSLWCVAVVAWPCGAAIAENTAVLALDEALGIAEQRSEQLRANDAAALAARAMAVAAAEAPDPILTAGINNLPVNGPDEFRLDSDFMTMRSVALSRELTRHDKRDARAARFEREAEAAEAGRVLALAELQRATATAWLERYFGIRAHEVLSLQRQQAALQVEAAELAYRGGRGPQSDVFAARASVAEIDDRLAERARDNEVAATKLERWIGTAAARPLGGLPPMTAVPLNPADLEQQLAHHPQIALLSSQEQVAKAEADIARTETRSDWTIEVMYSERGPNFSDMMSLNVSKPLQWREARRQGREVAAHLATVARMRAQREEGTRSHAAAVRALLQSWQANRQRLDRYAGTLISLAAQRTAAATTAYGAGTGSLGAALDARVAEIEVRLAELELQLETAMLWAELTYLVPAGHRPTAE